MHHEIMINVIWH